MIYYLRVYDKVTGTLLGHLADISPDGMMIVSESPVDAGAKFQCRMMLPRELKASQEILFSAQSIWTKKDVNPDFYATGFKIDNIAAADIQVMDILIDEFGFRD